MRAKKIIITFRIALVLTISANAQKKIVSISLGPSIGLPLNFSDGYKTGFGGGLRGYYGLSEHGSLLINIYVAQFESSEFSNTLSFSGIKLGYRSFLGNTKLFLYGDVGYAHAAGDNTYSTYSTGTHFALGSGFGYSLPLGQRGHVDVIPSCNISFQNVKNKTWLDFYIAYRFDLNRK